MWFGHTQMLKRVCVCTYIGWWLGQNKIKYLIIFFSEINSEGHSDMVLGGWGMSHIIKSSKALKNRVKVKNI